MSATLPRERKSQWALASLSLCWRDQLGPVVRRAYLGVNVEDKPTDPELCDRIAELFEAKAKVAREAARLAREEMA